MQSAGHRPRLRDSQLDERYEAVGSVVVPGAARCSVRPLRRLHRRLVGTEPQGFHSTPYDGAPDELVHDHPVLHSSPPNHRWRARVVAGLAVVAADSMAVHYTQSAEGVLERHELEDRLFTDDTFGAASLPASAHPCGSIEFVAPRFDVDDVSGLARHEGRRGR